jgi:biotin carboxyl carrier protein
MNREKKLRSLPEGELYSVRIARASEGYLVSGLPEGREATVTGSSEDGVLSVLTDAGHSYEASVTRLDGEIHVEVGHRRYRFGSGSRDRASRSDGARSRVEVKAPMPGKVVSVLVPEGQAVAAGEPVLLFEAMKMQNEIRSPQNGVVAQMLVSPGQAVEARECLYIVDPP